MMNELANYAEARHNNRDCVVTTHAPLVKRVAYHVMSGLRLSLDEEDLIQAGMIGLLEASRNYDRAKGAKFETYAWIRIRGAMLDEIRKYSLAPRSVYRKARKVAEAVRSVERNEGRDANDAEVAEALQVTLEEYHQILQDIGSYLVVSVEDVGVDDDTLSRYGRDHSVTPFDELQKESLKRYLGEAIACLPEREHYVLTLYYYKELSLREISLVLGISQCRVSQLRSQALIRLQARLVHWRPTN